MKPDRVFVAVQSVLAIVAVAAATTFAASGLPDSTALLGAVPSALALGGALLVLGFFNVWLPRGDAVDTTVPIAFAAGAMLHPLVAAGVVLLARCATVALKPRGHTLLAAIEQVGRRAVLMSATYWLLHPLMTRGLDPQAPWLWLVPVLAAAAAFVAIDALVEQSHAAVRFRAPIRALVAGAIRLQGWMLAAEISTAVLTVVLFKDLASWGLLVTVGLLLIMRQSFALLLEVRASYTSTVEVLARSLEAYDPGRRGHAERVAHMSTEAGRMIGLQGKRLEGLTYAALFHDVGRLGSDDPTAQPEHSSAEILGSVGFLAGALPILRVLDTAGDDETSLDEDDLISAYLVARFSALDGELNGEITAESAELANSIGARLYASTRAAVERAVRRVEREARAGHMPTSDLADVLT
jgi:hypothetical protein